MVSFRTNSEKKISDNRALGQKVEIWTSKIISPPKLFTNKETLIAYKSL